MRRNGRGGREVEPASVSGIPRLAPGGGFQRTFKNRDDCSGRVTQLAGAPSRYTKVVAVIPGQGTYRKQPMIAGISGTTHLSQKRKKINKFFFKKRVGMTNA